MRFRTGQDLQNPLRKTSIMFTAVFVNDNFYQALRFESQADDIANRVFLTSTFKTSTWQVHSAFWVGDYIASLL